MSEKFFIIWNPKSRQPPTKRFSTRAEAQTVANNMAVTYREPFYVCEAVSLAESVQPVTVTELK